MPKKKVSSGRTSSAAELKAEHDRLALKAAEEQRLRRYERKREEMRRRREEQERAVKEKIIENQIKREKQFNERRKDIAAGHQLADDIQSYLSLHELHRRTKLKKQFDEWNRDVYGAIQDQINDKIDGMTDDELNRRKRTDFQNYLDTSNAKGSCIFRDIIIESEYDPLEPNRNSVKFHSDHIQDPLKRILDKHHEETTMLGNCDDNKPSEPRRSKGGKVRDMLDATSWGTGNIEATPHGYFAKLMDDSLPTKNKSATKAISNKTYQSKIPCFDHFNIPIGNEFAIAECPVGKRSFTIKGNIRSLA